MATVGALATKYGPAVASALSAKAQSDAANRTQETQNTLTRDQVASRAADQNNTATDSRAKTVQDAQNNAYKNAMRAAYAMNLKDFKFTRPEGVPEMSLGQGAATQLGPEGKAAAAEMNRRAMAQLLDPTLGPSSLPPVERTGASALPTASWMEKYGGLLALGANAASQWTPASKTPLPSTSFGSNAIYPLAPGETWSPDNGR